MSQYKTGTVAVETDSQTVIGTGTLWLANVTVGDLFIVADTNVSYVVAAVVSNTQITLRPQSQMTAHER